VIKLRLQARGRPRRHDSPDTQKRVRTRKCVGMTKRGVSQLRLQACERTRPHDGPGAQKRVRTRKCVGMTKRGVSQLRLQARGRSARSGLAGRCFLCNTASGLTRHRADGDRHHARGNSSSSPRGGWKPGPIRRLDRGCYCDKRERERERDASALLRHLPTGVFRPAAIPGTYVPIELTRKQLPHRSDTGPSPKETLYCATRSTTGGRPKPDPMFSALGAPLQETLYSTS
jgi:hypothetical protein